MKVKYIFPVTATNQDDIMSIEINQKSPIPRVGEIVKLDQWIKTEGFALLVNGSVRKVEHYITGDNYLAKVFLEKTTD